MGLQPHRKNNISFSAVPVLPSRWRSRRLWTSTFLSMACTAATTVHREMAAVCRCASFAAGGGGRGRGCRDVRHSESHSEVGAAVASAMALRCPVLSRESPPHAGPAAQCSLQTARRGLAVLALTGLARQSGFRGRWDAE